MTNVYAVYYYRACIEFTAWVEQLETLRVEAFFIFVVMRRTSKRMDVIAVKRFLIIFLQLGKKIVN